MALKIATTTVVDNSRNLTNIANATTSGTASTFVLRDANGFLPGRLANGLTLAVSGTGLSGSATYNGSTAATFTVTSNATASNTGSAIVARDASGNFSAGTVTASLNGNVTLSTSNGFGSRTLSTLTPSAGADGDIWYQY